MQILVSLFFLCTWISIAGERNCAICYEEITLQNDARHLMKAHCLEKHAQEFHKSCLLNAFNKGLRTCPLCRQELSLQACMLCKNYIEKDESAQDFSAKHIFRGKCLTRHASRMHGDCLRDYIHQREEHYREAFCLECGTKISQEPYNVLPTMKRIFKKHVEPPLSAAIVSAIGYAFQSVSDDNVAAHAYLMIASSLTGFIVYLSRK